LRSDEAEQLEIFFHKARQFYDSSSIVLAPCVRGEKVYSITVDGKTAPLTEKPVRRGAETTVYVTKGYSIYKNKVDYTCDVDLRKGGGEAGAIGWFTVSG
jgi:hypothetical protein